MREQEALANRQDSPVLVVDSDPDGRCFLSRLLRRGGFQPHPVASGEEALEVARLRRPQVVVLEVRLGDISGYEVCRSLREEFGDDIGILFVSADRTEPADRVAGLLIGADDYLPKPLTGDELLARARSLARRAGANDHLRRAGLHGGLTHREMEVLHLLAEGLDQGAIAGRLFITHKTVGKHIEHILTKLPARSRAEAVAIFYQRGLHAPRVEYAGAA